MSDRVSAGQGETAEQDAEAIRMAVSHIARGCRAGTSHNPAVYENEISAAVERLLVRVQEAKKESAHKDQRIVQQRRRLAELEAIVADHASHYEAAITRAGETAQRHIKAWREASSENHRLRRRVQELTGERDEAMKVQVRIDRMLRERLDEAERRVQEAERALRIGDTLASYAAALANRLPRFRYAVQDVVAEWRAARPMLDGDDLPDEPGDVGSDLEPDQGVSWPISKGRHRREQLEVEAHKPNCTVVRWPDGFVLLMHGVEMAEDPTFRPELEEIARRIRGQVQGG